MLLSQSDLGPRTGVPAPARFQRIAAVILLCTLCALPRLGPAATLAGSLILFSAPTNIDLSAEGQLDWGHWGLMSEWNYNHKYGIAQQISGSFLTDTNDGYPPPDGPYRLTDGTVTFSWSNGVPAFAATNTPTGIYIYGDKVAPGANPTGFQIQCPADVTSRRLKIYLGVLQEKTTTFTATLANAPTYVDTSLTNSGGIANGVYVLDFTGDFPGQILTVTFTSTDFSGNMRLLAATLAGTDAPPTVSITAPASGSVFGAPATVSLSATGADPDGAVTNLSLLCGTNLVGSVPGPVLNLTVTNLTASNYNFLAVATDDHGLSITSAPVTVYVTNAGGTLTASSATPPFTVDLTAAGTSGWGQWGLTTNTDFNSRALVPSLVSNLVPLNAGPADLVQYSDNPTAFSWSDGAPTPAVGATTTGVFLYGSRFPLPVFQLTVPATNFVRLLKLYVGLYGCQGQFNAWLDDFSALPYSDSSLLAVYNNAYAVYSVTYASPNPGANLVVTWSPLTMFDVNYGLVNWQAATLWQQPIPPTLQILPPPGPNQFAFSFHGQATVNYTVFSADSLSPSNWQVVTNFMGADADAVIVDSAMSPTQRFYRVQAQ